MHLPAETVWSIVLAATLALVLLLGALQRRTRRDLKRRRADLFAASYGILDSYRITQAGVDYPEMQATYRGHAFHVDVVVDTLTFRKLPVLWLRVSLLAPLPGMATFDILVRSQNVEFYSPSADLPHRLEPRTGWPADAMVRTDNQGRLPELGVLDRHIVLFQSPQVKELLVTPKGVRIVRMLDQAKRAEYLVMRQAEFENAAVTPELLRGLMDRALDLYQDLRA